MNSKVGIVILFLHLAGGFLYAQAPSKEAMNKFALYTKDKKFADLENAKKLIDNAFQTRRDSLSYRNNLIRGLIYSTLAYVDSNRRLQYKTDPIQVGLQSLSNLKNSKLNDEHETERNYIKQQLASAFLIEANRALSDFKYEEAYDAYRWVDSLNSGSLPMVKHNLAILSQRLGYRSRAMGYFEQLLDADPKASPVYYLTLAELYEAQSNSNKALDIIRRGRREFPKNQDLLFKEINIYADNGVYDKISALIDEALKLDPDNISLNYLAGFSSQASGMPKQAEHFYKKIIEMAPNNYDANYALGLLYLKLYSEEKNPREEYLEKAASYLNKAEEINPNSVNVLKSLSILYKESGNMLKLEEVNNKLNQIILN